MELKHNKFSVRIPDNPTFNRTFMELKRGMPSGVRSYKRTFNRTFMELKPDKGTCFNEVIDTFNRTFMELKPARVL